jgi:hypothetical protein
MPSSIKTPLDIHKHSYNNIFEIEKKKSPLYKQYRSNKLLKGNNNCFIVKIENKD